MNREMRFHIELSIAMRIDFIKYGHPCATPIHKPKDLTNEQMQLVIDLTEMKDLLTQKYDNDFMKRLG